MEMQIAVDLQKQGGKGSKLEWRGGGLSRSCPLTSQSYL